MKDYKDQVIVITGAANGIGLGLAGALGKRGAKVVLTDILGEDLQKAVRKLQADGAAAEGFPMDVSKEEDWKALLAHVLETYGRADMLINNAGIMYNKPYDCFGAADWEWYLKVNVMGPVFGCNTFYPAMQKQGGGHISTVISQASLGPLNGALIGAPYAPSKSACLTFVEQFAIMMRERKTGVTCSAIMPSVVNTTISDRVENPLVRPRELRDNPSIDNTPAQVKAAAKAYVEKLAHPKNATEQMMAYGMGVITVDQAVEKILDGFEKGYFLIYTHPGRCDAINRQEMDIRLAGYKQPRPQADATAEYVKLSGTNI